MSLNLDFERVNYRKKILLNDRDYINRFITDSRGKRRINLNDFNIAVDDIYEGGITGSSGNIIPSSRKNKNDIITDYSSLNLNGETCNLTSEIKNTLINNKTHSKFSKNKSTMHKRFATSMVNVTTSIRNDSNSTLISRNNTMANYKKSTKTGNKLSSSQSSAGIRKINLKVIKESMSKF
jgi:hypothetical protein